VHAIDMALRKALEPHYAILQDMALLDYRVRILKQQDATAAMPRVKIESAGHVNGQHEYWNTIGVSTNIIEASVSALCDSYVWLLLKSGIKSIS
jgi:2-isopropylmalate synthase